MPPSPSKRRKLSPERSAPGTPNRAPADRDATHATSERPRYASPTKASLARSGAEGMERPTSAGIGAPASTAGEIGSTQERPVERSLFVSPATEPRTQTTEPTSQATEVVRSQTPSRTSGLTAPPRRRSRTPGRAAAGAEVASDAAQETAKGVSVGGAAGTEDFAIQNPFRRAGLRRSPPPGAALPEVAEAQKQEPSRPDAPGLTEPQREPERADVAEVQVQEPSRPAELSRPAAEPSRPAEPDLPPTPTQRGIPDPVVTTPPTGIHDTPSRRGKRKAKGSPLKPRPQATKGKEPERPAEATEPEPEPANKRQRTAETANRHLVPADPHAEKKRLRDQLLKEIDELQADVELAEEENERLRQHYTSTKAFEEPTLPDEILDLLIRTTAELRPEAPPPKPTSLLSSIRSFLPFAPRPRRPPIPLPKQEPDLPTHLPIKLEDPLPYLKLFTPLEYNSTITLLPPTPPGSGTDDAPGPLLQNHDIQISAPFSLLSASLNLVVDTSRFSVASLSLASLTPAAEAELGTWIRARAGSEGVLGKDVSAVCWAMGRWYEVAMRRARFWLECERRFGSGEGRRREVLRLKEVGRRRKAGPRAGSRRILRVEGGGAEGDGEDGAEGEAVDGGEIHDDEEGEDGVGKEKWTRKQIRQQMGRSVMILDDGKVELKIGWEIRFDWTGEAESYITGRARVPRGCEFGVSHVVMIFH
jgi:hypothetical protein